MSRLFSFFLRSLSTLIFFMTISGVVQNHLIASLIVFNKYEQEKAFYQKLLSKYEDFADEHVQVYYKKIDSIVSDPISGRDHWSFPVVMMAGKKIIPDSDGTYRSGTLSFKIHQPEKFNPTQDMFVLVDLCHSTAVGKQRCKYCVEKKELYVTRIEEYNDFFKNTFKQGVFWRKKLTLKATLRNDDGKSYQINIESTSELNHPVKIQGMAVVYNKEQETTGISFDIVDPFGGSIDHLDPVFSCKHKKSDVDEKIYCVHQHRLFECSAKDVFGFFDSPKNRNLWIPDETDFYDVKKGTVVTCLPSCYRVQGSYPETPVEPFTWIFGDDKDHHSFYKLDGTIIFQDQNDYLYSPGDGTLSVTLQYKAIAREYLTSNNLVELHLLSRLMNPVLKMHKNVIFAGGHQSWPVGIYRKIESEDKILWTRVESENPIEIEQIIRNDSRLLSSYSDSVIKNMPFSCSSNSIVSTFSHAETRQITAEESMAWCNAAQKFFHHFGTQINHCDQRILDGLPTWNKIIQLDLS